MGLFINIIKSKPSLLETLFGNAYFRERQWRKAAKVLATRSGILFDMGGSTPYQGYISRGILGPDTQYFSLDNFAPANPHIVADVSQIPLANESVDSIFCNAVLEHVYNPQTAIDEMHRVLKLDGLAMFSVPFIYPYHDRIDYFRFTDIALKDMFSKFWNVEIVPIGDYFYVTLLFLTGYNFNLAKYLSPFLHPIRFFVHLWIMVYNKLFSNGNHRDHLRSLYRSPVGWYIYCQKECGEFSRGEL